ncbi:L-lactate dehydrogenase (cytochrome) [Meinhardsimonia xiamenensis]|jgi:L-lactate dehydrogenase (cytochrome)|uniref:L-lactate dehydrogenase (Cytochrome) n=1 Tax=Meinhardsimonia xiamenensis TaxID=990712 RepID=A0A1G9CIM1_9RHOB|nr:alpha-hydroxy acid oxidase [Meinhardsimonia xiamenensis]PRX38354.1 L-lactate dehydrogenase (cytochrome) [Meinhardsimonia xiamenensis]SDK51265.1 L-lactate dehydrogenase (cytochrome) [Meinhardsimonia xiamenensis]
MDLDHSHPAISDLAARARRRIPRFVWDYLDSATGSESTLRRNREMLDSVRLVPSILHGEIAPDLSTQLLGREWSRPFGIAPVGMSGLMWPDAERILAGMAGATNIPYCLSTVATRTPEEVGPHVAEAGWFQLYPPRDREILTDMLRRARSAGFRTLVLTVDVPVASRRERQRKGGLTHPPRLTPRIMAQTAIRPAWALGTLRHGMPRLRFMESYRSHRGPLPSTQHIGYLLRTSPDRDYLARLRDAWKGPLVVKGVLRADDAAALVGAGVDAVWVSNHAGRQFDAAPSTIEVLAAIRAAVPAGFPVIFDSGVESGLDILRAFALGADFVMLGRAFHYGLAAFGRRGAAHVVHILTEDLKANMGQLGIARPEEARHVPLIGPVARAP